MIQVRPKAMLIRRAVPVLFLSVLLAGCANNVDEPGDQAVETPASAVASPSEIIDLPSPSGKPAAGGDTITGTVSAGVEPNCLILQDAKGSHLLVFDDPALRDAAEQGSKVTITGRSEPGMMSTCQQGVPFVVTAVRPG